MTEGEEDEPIPVVKNSPKSKDKSNAKAAAATPGGGSAAQAAMARIVEAEKKQARDAQLEEIMRQQKE